MEEVAFGHGSDARLAGLPPSVNPYPSQSPEARQWRRGWQDLDAFWGCWVKERWPVRELPRVEVLQ